MQVGGRKRGSFPKGAASTCVLPWLDIYQVRGWWVGLPHSRSHYKRIMSLFEWICPWTHSAPDKKRKQKQETKNSPKVGEYPKARKQLEVYSQMSVSHRVLGGPKPPGFLFYCRTVQVWHREDEGFHPQCHGWSLNSCSTEGRKSGQLWEESKQKKGPERRKRGWKMRDRTGHRGRITQLLPLLALEEFV